MNENRTSSILLATLLVCLLTLAPHAASAAVPTPAAGPVLTIKSPTANVRSGPGLAYPVIGAARKGQQFPITGRVAANTWWQVDFQGKPAWIAASVSTVSAGATSAPLVTQIPPPPATSKAAAASAAPASPAGGGRIAFARGRGDQTDVAVLDVATGKISSPAPNGRQPDMRQDGLLVFNGQGGGTESLFTVRPDGSFLTQVSRFAEDSYPQWAADGSALIFHSTAGGSEPLIFEQLDPSGPQDLIYMRVEYENREGGTPVPIYGRFPTWVGPGRIAFTGCDGWVGGSKCGIWSMDTGKYMDFRPLRLTQDPADRPTDAHGPILLFSSPVAGNWDVYVIDSTPPARKITPKAVPRQLTNDPAQDLGATFSPDGKRIAFISNRGGGWGIWVMNADGSQQRLLAPVPEGFGPQWEEERLSWGR